MSKPNDERIVKLEAKKCFECPEYVEVDRAAKYDVAMPQFVVGGGDGYSMLKDAKVKSYGKENKTLAMNFDRSFFD